MSITPIQLLNRIGQSGAPPSLYAGELAYNQPNTAAPQKRQPKAAARKA